MRKTARARPAACRPFETALEETAFGGLTPDARLREHLDSCSRCAARWARERALYAAPPGLRARVIETAKREFALARPGGGVASWLRRFGESVRAILAPPAPARPAGDAHPVPIREFLAEGDDVGSGTPVIASYGPEVLGLLTVVIGDVDAASRAFSIFAEDLCKDIRALRRAANPRVRIYRLAWSAAQRLAASGSSPARERVPAGTRDDRLARLRAALDAEERMFLVLRLDRGLGWGEIAEVLSTEDGVATEGALRKRFARLKEKLARLAREQGLLEE